MISKRGLMCLFRPAIAVLVSFCVFGSWRVCHGGVLVSRTNTWRYVKGTAESSNPRTAWREIGFDDSGWGTVDRAPFGYGTQTYETGTYETLLDMQNKYSCIFMRKQFNVADPSAISALQLKVLYDDGFIVWINGDRVRDVNEPDRTIYNALATGSHECNGGEGSVAVYEVMPLGMGTNAIRNLLVPGATNVIAVQAFNVTTNSSDFMIDVELVDGVGDTKFSHDRGFYDAPFELTIRTATSGATIKCTLNGKDPSTAGSVDLIEGPAPLTVSIDPSSTTKRTVNGMAPPCVTVRACAEKGGLEPTDVDTQTYIFLHSVTNQGNCMGSENWIPGAGCSGYDMSDATPAQRMSTTMDSDIVGHGTYGPKLIGALRSIPTLSIVGDYADIFGDADGIWHNSLQYGIDWERPVSLEMIATNGATEFQVNCGIRTSGAWSRIGGKSKISVSCRFRSQYGTPRLRHKLFKGSDVSSFDHIRLRAQGNDKFGWEEEKAAYVRDTFGRQIQRDMGWTSPHDTWCHLYVNGLYWGVYNPCEVPSPAWMASHYDGDEEDYDVLANRKRQELLPTPPANIPRVISASSESSAYRAERRAAMYALTNIVLGSAMSNNSNYEQAKNYLDMAQQADYNLIEIWAHNGDWRAHKWGFNEPWGSNWRAGRKSRNRGPNDAQYHFIVWDIELGMHNANVAIDNTDWEGIVDLQDELGLVGDASPEYKMLFADRVYKHMIQDGGVLTPAVLTNKWMALTNQVALALIAESARWGDSRSSTPITVDDWATECAAVVNTFLKNRTPNFIGYLKTRGLYPTSVEPPAFNRQGGEVVSGFVLTMTTGSGGTICYTTDGVDPRLPGGSSYGGAVKGGSPQTNTVTQTTYVKARVRLSTGAWSALNEATFNVAFAATDVRVTEIMYHGLDNDPLEPTYDDSDFDFIEFRNTGGQEIDLSGFEVEGIGYTFPAGYTVGVGDYIVLVANSNAFATRYSGSLVDAVYPGNLNNGGETIRLKNSDGQTVLSVRYEDQELNMQERDFGFWPLSADGLGYSLVNMNPGGDPDNPENWRASAALYGNPGAADPAPAYGVGVIISEVLAHSDLTTGDAIELQNPTGSQIDIGGWYLSYKFDRDDPDNDYDLKKYQIANGTKIPAGGYVAFYQTNAANPFLWGLSEYGDDVYLASGTNGNLTGWVVGLRFGATSNSVSLGIHTTTEGTDVAMMSSRTFGSANSAPKVGPVVINEIMYDPAETGSSVSNEFIELYNLGGSPVDLTGWDLEGAGGYDFTNVTIGAHNYLVLLDTNALVTTNSFRSDHGIPASVPILGANFDLGNNGETLKLEMPNDEVGQPDILVEKVCYNDKSPWPPEAAGEGPSLERYAAGDYGNDPINWRANNNGGTPGQSNTFSVGNAIFKGSSWRYHDEGWDLGTAWRGASYNDAAWDRGDGVLGYDTGGDEISWINRILDYGSDPNDRHPTYYFRKVFILNEEPGDVSSLKLNALYDDGFVAYLNAQEVAREAMPVGTILYTNHASSARELSGPTDFQEINISTYTGALVKGQNVLAVEVHQAAADSSDMIWDASLTYDVSGLPSAHVDMTPGQSFTDPIDVYIWSDTAGATIYYTTDGSEPGPGDTTIVSSNYFTLNHTATVKAKAVAADHNAGTDQETFTLTGRDVIFAAGSSSGMEETEPVQISVRLSTASGSQVTVDYAVDEGTGTALRDADFVLADGTLTFSPGQTNKTITLQVYEDVAVEADETVVIDLSNASGASVGSPGTYTRTIQNDDGGSCDLSISASSDDAEEFTSDHTVHDLASTDLELIDDHGSEQVVGLRFQSVPLPQGAQITEAHVQFEADAASTGSISLTIKGQKVGNASTFTTNAYDISGRATTTASVGWSPPDWNTADEAGSAQRTPDLKTIIQEIVNQETWSSGNALVLIITGSGAGYREAESYDGEGAVPSLHIEGDVDDTVEKIGRGATWMYRKGTEEASDPVEAWRAVDYDDSVGWSGPSAAAFGYSTDGGEGPFGTDLSDMTNAPGYTSVYLRKTFALANPELVSRIELAAEYDDGFIAWLNGKEVARVNMGGTVNTFMPYSTNALSAEEPTEWSDTLTGAELPVLGTSNVLAVHAFNQSTGSSDFKIDMDLAVKESSTAPADGDADGMSDPWESDNFGGTDETGGGPLDDYDGDGIINIREYILGLDPDNTNDFLPMTVTLSGTEIVVDFPTRQATGTGYAGLSRRYGLERSDDLMQDWLWQLIPGHTNIEGTGQTVVYTNGAPSGFRSYRTRVWLDGGQ